MYLLYHLILTIAKMNLCVLIYSEQQRFLLCSSRGDVSVVLVHILRRANQVRKLQSSREAEGGAERNRGGASTGHLDEDIEGSVKDWDVSTSAL